MNFKQFRLTQPNWRGAKIRRRDLTIALVLLSAIVVAQPSAAQPSAAEPSAAKSQSSGKAVQTIALKSPEESATTTITTPDSHFRLLGYGLFLVPIGLIPWQLSKGHLIRIGEES
jgi:hypothetical protein